MAAAPHRALNSKVKSAIRTKRGDARDHGRRTGTGLDGAGMFATITFSTILLTAIWCLLTDSFSPLNAILGLSVSLASLAIVREGIGRTSGKPWLLVKRPHRAILAFAIFVRELMKASFEIAIQLALPRRYWKFNPGIIGIALDAKTDLEIALFSNAITMVPGTLTVDISRDKKILFIHVLDASDHDDASVLDMKRGKIREQVKRDFERHIIRALQE